MSISSQFSRPTIALILSVAALFVACGSDDDGSDTESEGGSASTGGSSAATGGKKATGGSSAKAGASATAGGADAGGAASDGGTSASAGGVTGVVGTTSTSGVCAIGVRNGGDCDAATAVDCTRTTTNGAVQNCSCGDNDTWSCVSTTTGTGGATGSGGATARGGSTSTSTGTFTCSSQLDGDACTVVSSCTTGSGRVCTCDGSEWSCAAATGTGGATGSGGATAAGGATARGGATAAGGSTSAVAACDAQTRNGADCDSASDTTCGRTTGGGVAQTCTCGTNDTWSCVTTPTGTGGATGSGGNSGTGGSTSAIATCEGNRTTMVSTVCETEGESCQTPSLNSICTCDVAGANWTCENV